MNKFKGIILAGGTGTRLHPITLGVSKQLLPVYDKPLIYYPLSVLMLAGIKEILIISTPTDLPHFQNLLGDGSQFGIELSYCEQANPTGIPEAFILGEDFIAEDNCCLILGDNLFYGQYFSKFLDNAISKKEGATVFCYHVKDPERFGVVEVNKNNKVIGIEEKPREPKSNFAVTGIYFLDNQCVEFAKQLTPSKRGETEITDVLNKYLKKNQLSAELLGRGFAWLDTGTHDALLKAGQFVQTIEARQGLKIACLEEIAFRNGWIDLPDLEKQYGKFKQTGYGSYLKQLILENRASKKTK